MSRHFFFELTHREKFLSKSQPEFELAAEMAKLSMTFMEINKPILFKCKTLFFLERAYTKSYCSS